MGCMNQINSTNCVAVRLLSVLMLSLSFRAGFDENLRMPKI